MREPKKTSDVFAIAFSGKIHYRFFNFAAGCLATFGKNFFMDFPQPVSLSEIAALINAEIKGDEKALATGINEIHRVRKGDLAFVDHPKYYTKCLSSEASFIIINADVEVPPGKALLVVSDPFEAYQRIVAHFRPFQAVNQSPGHDSHIASSAIIMKGAIIGNHVTIGSDTVIHPNAVIMDHCVIGNRVVVQSGTVIGSDAFYYNKKTDRPVHFKKMLSCGRVVISDDVEIGANCTIDRGVTADTLIGAGTRIDNLVHIGHDVVIGKNCLLAAQVGIAGATVLEDEVILWGQVGVNKTIRIGQGAEVNGQSGVTTSIEGKKKYFGTPAIDVVKKGKELVWISRIPALWKKVMES